MAAVLCASYALIVRNTSVARIDLERYACNVARVVQLAQCGCLHLFAAARLIRTLELVQDEVSQLHDVLMYAPYGGVQIVVEI